MARKHPDVPFVIDFHTHMLTRRMNHIVADAIPGLKVVVAHGGGYFPTYMGRLDRDILKPEAVANIKGKPSDYLRHFYYDSCVYDSLALEMLFRRVGADRIVLGADYPVGDVDPVGVIKQAVTLPAPELAMVASRHGRTPARHRGAEER
jgi:aminocarboxymuconate-semialdehyde decarboxylase